MFGIMLLVRKHSVRFHSRQMEPVHSPLIQSYEKNSFKLNALLSYEQNIFLDDVYHHT